MVWFGSKKAGLPAAGAPKERTGLPGARADEPDEPGSKPEPLAAVVFEERTGLSEVEAVDLSPLECLPKENDAMRNTMMQDKLEEVLAHPQIHSGLYSHDRDSGLILAAEGAIRRKLKKAEPHTHKKKGKAGSVIPRTIPPPNKANPFMVHTQPTSTLAEDLEEARVPRPAEAIRTNPEVEPATQQTIEDHTLQPPVAAPDAALPSQSPTMQSAKIAAGPVAQENPVAFSPELKRMVDSLRTAKSAQLFTLEQLHARREKVEAELADKQRELEGIDRQVTLTRENMQKIENTIAASTLLAEQAASIDPNLLGKSAHRKAAYKGTGEGKSAYQTARWKTDDPSVCRQQDVLEIVNANPGIDWKAATVRKKLPASKQAHGQNIVIAAMLSNLAKENKIVRAGRGDYRALNS